MERAIKDRQGYTFLANENSHLLEPHHPVPVLARALKSCPIRTMKSLTARASSVHGARR